VSQEKRKEGRTIIIGDIHGCADELNDLLAEIGATEHDRLISVGDLICKGPDSLAVLKWAMTTPNVRCVLGNHEARFLKHWRLGTRSQEKPYDAETYAQLGGSYEECMQFLNSLPLFIEEPEWSVVHAGLDVRKGSLRNQRSEDLLNLRRIQDLDVPWFETYSREHLVIFGHWARREPVIRRNVVGLDTGCVYGGALTAVILPERRMVSVPARREYRRKPTWTV